MNRMCEEVCEYSRPVEMILAEINRKMEEAKHYFRDSVNEKDWQFWKGVWRAYIESYIIAVEVLAEVKKELKK